MTTTQPDILNLAEQILNRIHGWEPQLKSELADFAAMISSRFATAIAAESRLAQVEEEAAAMRKAANHALIVLQCDALECTWCQGMAWHRGDPCEHCDYLCTPARSLQIALAANAGTALLTELEAAKKRIAELERLVAASTPFIREAEQRAPFHEPDYNLDAHIELTVTVGECRALAAALAGSPQAGEQAGCEQQAARRAAEREAHP